MATGTINAGYKDITDQFVWDSTVQQKQALQIGNLIIVRFQASRTGSKNAWIYATIPASLGIVDGRWTGIAIAANAAYYIRIYGTQPNQDLRTESFASSISWIQGQIELVRNAPAIA